MPIPFIEEKVKSFCRYFDWEEDSEQAHELRTALATLEAEVRKEERERRPHITAELKTPSGGYIGTVHVMSDIGFGRMGDPQAYVDKVMEKCVYSLVDVIMHKGAAAISEKGHPPNN